MAANCMQGIRGSLKSCCFKIKVHIRTVDVSKGTNVLQVNSVITSMPILHLYVLPFITDCKASLESASISAIALKSFFH